jgi:hypothetical protein
MFSHAYSLGQEGDFFLVDVDHNIALGTCVLSRAYELSLIN